MNNKESIIIINTTISSRINHMNAVIRDRYLRYTRRVNNAFAKAFAWIPRVTVTITKRGIK